MHQHDAHAYQPTSQQPKVNIGQLRAALVTDEHPKTYDDTDTGYAPMRLMRGEEVIAPNLHVADNMLSRMRGLLGRKSLLPGEGLWIKPCNSIHMMFMRFAIDVVFLDGNLQVVRSYSTVRPWRVARGGKFAKSVLELRSGTIAFYNIRVGDKFGVED